MKEKIDDKAVCNSIPTESFSFSKEVENLVDPVNVGTIHFLQQLNQFLPKKIQRLLMKSSSKKVPFMGFIVEPYCSFLCYEIKDTIKASALLSENFELVKTSVFTDDKPKYYCILGSFRAHTSAFWGARTEFYIIARNKRTDLLSWVIVDYDTNTISYDSKRGLLSPNSRSIITINHRGNLFVDIENQELKRQLTYSFNIETGKMKNLNQKLWLEGNLSVGYGKELADVDDSVFSLKFEPCEVEKALEINPDTVNLNNNNWYKEILGNKPEKVVCFPYSQHFISDSPGYSSNLKNKKELIESIKLIDFSNVKVISTKSLKYVFILSSLVSAIVTAILLILYISK